MHKSENLTFFNFLKTSGRIVLSIENDVVEPVTGNLQQELYFICQLNNICFDQFPVSPPEAHRVCFLISHGKVFQSFF